MINFISKTASTEKSSQRELLSVNCHRDLNILAHAQMEELDIGSRCGGHGFCGGDRIQVPLDTQLVSPITEREREHLNPEELQAGWRLGCQCWPEKNDLNFSVIVPHLIDNSKEVFHDNSNS